MWPSFTDYVLKKKSIYRILEFEKLLQLIISFGVTKGYCFITTIAM